MTAMKLQEVSNGEVKGVMVVTADNEKAMVGWDQWVLLMRRILELPTPPTTDESINTALNLANNYGGFDGGHHKMWVIDQMVRALTGGDYEAWVERHNDGEDGPNTYEWDEGMAP